MSEKSLTQILPLLKVQDRVSVTFEGETHVGHVINIGNDHIEVIMTIDGDEAYAELYEDNHDYEIEIIQ